MTTSSLHTAHVPYSRLDREIFDVQTCKATTQKFIDTVAYEENYKPSRNKAYVLRCNLSIKSRANISHCLCFVLNLIGWSFLGFPPPELFIQPRGSGFCDANPGDPGVGVCLPAKWIENHRISVVNWLCTE